jgi:4-aminobutyrate aminotransferase / (S)-3-amino-2-methylpropionate transaminase / 5-aminovalerate transaminase
MDQDRLRAPADLTNRMEARERDLLSTESVASSYGDTVHYAARPPIFSRCEGSFLFDLKGQPYLDLQMSYSAVNLGYGNKRINAAVTRQLETLPQLSSQFLHEGRIELASKITESVKRAFGLSGRVQFSVGGAQAVEEALKLVRKHTGKSRMLAFQGGYHGRTLGTSAITSSYRYREGLGEFPERAEFIPFPHCLRCPFDMQRPSCNLFCARQFERRFEHEYVGLWNPVTNSAEFGALFFEPVQGTGGYIAPPDGYLSRVAAACRQHGILLVDDEIQMGFFRTGRMWAAERFDVAPDILVFGKSLTNGLNPLSGVWAREELISPECWPPGSSHTTFAANPLGTAAGNEVMRIFEETDYRSDVEQKGDYFLDVLRSLQSAHPEIGEIGGIGLALRVEICNPDGRTPDPALTNRMFQQGLEAELEVGGARYGVVLDIGGYFKSTLTLAPSLNVSRQEIDLAGNLLDLLITKCRNK